ncbi:MAG: hypothetical protein IT380_30525 [Myxococcales bacterium]|nr:hypothetical protein [Myxococcales bacterium]
MNQLLFALLLGPIALPALAARDRNPKRGLRRALVLVLAFTVLWAVLVLSVFPDSLEVQP